MMNLDAYSGLISSENGKRVQLLLIRVNWFLLVGFVAAHTFYSFPSLPRLVRSSEMLALRLISGIASLLFVGVLLPAIARVLMSDAVARIRKGPNGGGLEKFASGLTEVVYECQTLVMLVISFVLPIVCCLFSMIGLVYIIFKHSSPFLQ